MPPAADGTLDSNWPASVGAEAIKQNSKNSLEKS